jgi:hypothetical protein
MDMSMEDGKEADRRHGDGKRCLDAEGDVAPSTITEKAIPASTNGTGTPVTPKKPPRAMTLTKVSGTSHSARPPSW